MVGQHHRFMGHKLEQTPEDSEGQGDLACCGHGVTKSQTHLHNSNRRCCWTCPGDHTLEKLPYCEKLPYYAGTAHF